jgi:spermidine synthase
LREEPAHALTPEGDELTLRHRDGAFEIRFNGWEVMSSRSSLSEAVLARLVCADLPRAGARIVIGGLGMGYTLRATLDLAGPDARIVVAELVPAVVAWNRGPLASLAGRPLDDDRVEIRSGSVIDALSACEHCLDAILLDVDNGPDAVLYEPNRFLYSAAGLNLITKALAPAGILGLWSADRSAGFEASLDAVGMIWRRETVAIPTGRRGVEHTIYLARTRPRRGCQQEWPTSEGPLPDRDFAPLVEPTYDAASGEPTRQVEAATSPGKAGTDHL